MMRIVSLRPILAAAIVVSLAACGTDAPDPASDSRTAEGEVLDGSISDAMIPLDQLKSQGESLEVVPQDANESAFVEGGADADAEAATPVAEAPTDGDAPAED